MAGEIQLNSTTMATESSGSITAQLDTIRPNTTNGSLTLQGDSSDAGVTGLTIDSSGNATFAQTISGGTLGSSVVFPAGHVIKTEMTSQISGSTTSSTDVSVATPSFTTTVANSKIYIMMTLLVNTKASSGNNNFIYVKFYHGLTLLLDGFPIVGSLNDTDFRGVAAWNYLYSPNVSAGTTLNFDLKINANYASTVYIDSPTEPSHITFMEIAS